MRICDCVIPTNHPQVVLVYENAHRQADLYPPTEYIVLEDTSSLTCLVYKRSKHWNQKEGYPITLLWHSFPCKVSFCLWGIACVQLALTVAIQKLEIKKKRFEQSLWFWSRNLRVIPDCGKWENSRIRFIIIRWHLYFINYAHYTSYEWYTWRACVSLSSYFILSCLPLYFLPSNPCRECSDVARAPAATNSSSWNKSLCRWHNIKLNNTPTWSNCADSKPMVLCHLCYQGEGLITSYHNFVVNFESAVTVDLQAITL